MALILLCAFCSCKKSESVPAVAPNPDGNVYATGIVQTQSGNILKYWKNGNATELPNSGNHLAGLVTTGIVVSGGDVYVSGDDYNGLGNHVATYWKNAIAVHLSDSTIDCSTTGIAISGSDVYVSGNEGLVPGYWKNSDFVRVNDTSIRAVTTGIALSGQDVYLSGYTTNASPNTFPGYWKNGNFYVLGNNVITGYANAIAISGQDVYVAGSEYSSDSTGFPFSVATYWKNGSEVHLTKTGTGYQARLTSVFISGNDVFFVGLASQEPYDIFEGPAYWKNNSETDFSGGVVNSIFVVGNDVYIGGSTSFANGYKATIWENGVPVYLEDGTSISAICVSKN